MGILIDFPGSSRVDARFGKFTAPTDQPPVSSAPSPVDLFLSSIGTCASRADYPQKAYNQSHKFC